jgi:hypothetical protein
MNRIEWKKDRQGGREREGTRKAPKGKGRRMDCSRKEEETSERNI